MARTESRTKTSIWSDDDFRKLTRAAQRMYWMLFSQSTISLCGVLAITERRWATSASDETVETVRAALRELEEHHYALFDWDTEEVLVRSFVRHDGIARSPKTSEPAWRQLANIASPMLRAEAERQLRAVCEPPAGWDAPPTAHAADRLSDPPGNRVSAGSGRVVDSHPDTPRGRARAVSRLQSPSPVSYSSLPDPDIPHPPQAASTETGRTAPKGETKPDARTELELTHAVADACHGTNRSIVRAEAAALVVWAAPLDRKVVEEAIGWAGQQPKPPDLPRALAPVIASKAADRRIRLGPFQPPGGRRLE